MNRYLKSFIISSLIYVSLIASVFIVFENDDNFSDKSIEKPNVIAINMVSQAVVQKKKVEKKTPPKKKKIVKKKPVKKPVEKKVVKKKIIEKPLPKPVEEIPKETIVKEDIKEEVLEEDVQQEIVQAEPKQQVISTLKPKIDYDEIKAKQNIFFTKLRNKINENKSYPRSARRRGIQGMVEVKFQLCNDGNVKNIEFVSGKKIFKNSIIEAIEDSFPIEVDKSLFTFPKEFKISVEYILS